MHKFNLKFNLMLKEKKRKYIKKKKNLNSFC